MNQKCCNILKIKFHACRTLRQRGGEAKVRSSRSPIAMSVGKDKIWGSCREKIHCSQKFYPTSGGFLLYYAWFSANFSNIGPPAPCLPRLCQSLRKIVESSLCKKWQRTGIRKPRDDLERSLRHILNLIQGNWGQSGDKSLSEIYCIAAKSSRIVLRD